MFRHSFYSFRDTMSQWMAYFLLLTLFVSLFVFLPITVKAVNEPSTLALLNGSAAALTTATVGTEITGDAYVLVYTQLHAAGTGAQVWANADNFSVTIPLMLKKDEKLKVIKKFATDKGDTGSPEVQVALLSERIDRLAKHLKGNHKDNHSRRGLLAMVSKRRRLLNYLSSKDKKRHAALTKTLKLKK